nr:unnamed protein product [Callosobruchus analis]
MESCTISRVQPGDRHGSVSEAESDEENEEGDYTVYECPGLAPTGEMEVKNPLFQDDPTPAQTPASKPNATVADERRNEGMNEKKKDFTKILYLSLI